MRPLRVLHLVHTPGPGGTEAVVANLLAWIPRADAIQALACPAGPLAVTARETEVAWYPVAFEALRRPATAAGIIRSLTAAPAVSRQLARAIREFGPDIVHAHAAKAAVLAARCRRRGHAWKLVWHLHDYIPLGPLRRLWIRHARRAESIVAVSRHVAETVLGHAAAATVIPNAIAGQAHRDLSAGRRLLESVGVPEGSPVIGYAGRLDREKGVDVLLRAFGHISKEEPSARLLIAGSSPFEPEQTLDRLTRVAGDLGLEGRVHFLGRLPDLAGFYGALTLFALAAPREPFGLVVLEALAHGIPVVAFACGGPREVLEPFDSSLLVAPGDGAGFAAACCRVLRDPDVRQRVRHTGPQFVERAFSPHVLCRALLAHYRGLVAS